MLRPITAVIVTAFLITGCASTFSGFKDDVRRNVNYGKHVIHSKPLPQPIN